MVFSTKARNHTFYILISLTDRGLRFGALTYYFGQFFFVKLHENNRIGELAPSLLRSSREDGNK